MPIVCEGTLSRFVRVLNIFACATHWLACAFYFVCRQNADGHYATAPWRANSTSPTPFNKYTTAVYWSIMSLTTTGHVDIIKLDDDGERLGAIWEYIFAILICFATLIVFVYVNANFTALILKLNQRLEQYRTRLQARGPSPSRSGRKPGPTPPSSTPSPPPSSPAPPLPSVLRRASTST